MDTACPCLEPNTLVRLIRDPSRVGLLKSLDERAGRCIAVVQFPNAIQRIPCAQVRRVPDTLDEPAKLLANGEFSPPHSLRRVLAHVRIAGRLADMIYSMEATNTDFYPYQFKPVLKMLGSPTQSLLIADEVGLGKTIEAGLIWTELRARFACRRLLVLCPAALKDKWRFELSNKFNLDTNIVGAEDLLGLIEDPSRLARGFIAIASAQGLRPPVGWNNQDSENYAKTQAQLARFLSSQVGNEPLFDLLVIDEAHHLRNPETRVHQLGRLLQPIAHHRLFLSATPIHLRSRDLFSLLSLLDPDTFPDEQVLGQMIDANRPLIAARDAALKKASPHDLLTHLEQAATHPLLRNSAQLATLRQELERHDSSLTPAELGACLAERFESANLLANIISRTRRRDVKERHVVRQVTAHRADMTPLEADIYERVRTEIETYAKEKDTVSSFLFATPARLLASCIPAAIAHWRVQENDQQSEEETDEANGGRGHESLRPLVDHLTRLCRDLPDASELERNDTKFDRFLGVLREHFAASPTDKVIVFSTFRPTLRYLRRRLAAAGIAAALIHSGIDGREAVLEQFREDKKTRVLLSSEVGSEGIDLQFCRAIINYDLPWNPMRIEQRIGRIDRIGQEARAISVINLLHRDTIDERIYTRLYERLGIIKDALGDFEEVLGEEIQKLTADLLRRNLTAEEEARRTEQTAQAIENNRLQTKTLEDEAGSLIAHGDSILRAVNAAHNNHRFIGARDLANYIADALATLFPGCTVHEREEADLYDIGLTQDARLAYADWIEAHRYPAGDRLQRDFGPVLCRLGRPASGPRRRTEENLTQTHPFVQFLCKRLAEAGTANLRPAIAARVSPTRLTKPCPPGRYCILASHWRFESEIVQERIAYAGLGIPGAAPIADDLAEHLALAVAEHGTLWPEAANAPNRAEAAALCPKDLVDHLAERFRQEEISRQAEQTDRVEVQLRTLDQGYQRDRARIEETIAQQRCQGGRESIIRANEGRLRALEERVQRRRNAIEKRRQVSAQEEQFAALFIEVV